MEREGSDHQVKSAFRKGQEFLIRCHRQPAAPRRHAGRQIGRDDEGNAACRQLRRHKAAPAQIKRTGEAARGVIQPIKQPIRRVIQNGGDPIHPRHRPRSAARDKGSVKDAHLVGHGAVGCTLFPKRARRGRVFAEFAFGGKNHERI